MEIESGAETGLVIEEAEGLLGSDDESGALEATPAPAAEETKAAEKKSPASVPAAALARQWLDEEERIRLDEPEFDLLEAVAGSAAFRALVLAGESVGSAWRYSTMDQRLKEAEKLGGERMLRRLRENAARPVPMAAGGASANGSDAARLSDEEMRRIDERLKRGEKVYL